MGVSVDKLIVKYYATKGSPRFLKHKSTMHQFYRNQKTENTFKKLIFRTDFINTNTVLLSIAMRVWDTIRVLGTRQLGFVGNSKNLPASPLGYKIKRKVAKLSKQPHLNKSTHAILHTSCVKSRKATLTLQPDCTLRKFTFCTCLTLHSLSILSSDDLNGNKRICSKL